tara:strand:- start:6852 stop:7610 length:759 start_codon:yes stop_codon:yes gene_type:complete
MKYFVDLNCDIGESYYNHLVGNDAQVIPHISSCNIACGLHGGDPLTIQKAIEIALSHKVNIGAHPSFPDLKNFGRKFMTLSAEELKACLRYQIGALDNMTSNIGGMLKHVKPHGALYNAAAKDFDLAKIIVEVIGEFHDGLCLLGMANSEMEKAAIDSQTPFISEVFADRNYMDSGELVSREFKNAVIEDEKLVVERGLQMVFENGVTSEQGEFIELNAQSICVHGDTLNSVGLINALRFGFAENAIEVKAF